MNTSLAVADRFFAKVKKTDTCWLWAAAVTKSGYGRFGIRASHSVAAHRWSYEYHVGPIPEGLTIDHLCRVRACVNPDHLEPVTLRENLSRIPYRTHCPKGHRFTEANTYVQPNAIEGRRPNRTCRECNRRKTAAWRARRVAASLPATRDEDAS